MTATYFIGIDIGTQGARVAAFDNSGREMAASSEVFDLSADSRQERTPLYGGIPVTILFNRYVRNCQH